MLDLQDCSEFGRRWSTGVAARSCWPKVKRKRLFKQLALSMIQLAGMVGALTGLTCDEIFFRAQIGNTVRKKASASVHNCPSDILRYLCSQD